MYKFFSFVAGAMCGAIVGSVAALLLTPASGNELRAEMNARLEEAMREGRRAKQEMEQALNSEFERMKQGRS